MADTNTKPAPAHKRQKIQDSNKMMFLWITGASVVVGFAAVISWFLWQQTQFKMAIASEKEDTVATIRDNIEAVGELQDDIRILQTDPNLAATKAYKEQNPVEVILDALPADPNPLALGASIQNRLIGNTPGVRLERLNITPVGEGSTSRTNTENAISFNLVLVASNPNNLKKVLERFERSIRVIDINRLELERSGEGGEIQYTLTMSAQAYYEPEKLIELEDKKVDI